MPLYAYFCERCQVGGERFLSVKDWHPAAIACASCGGAALRDYRAERSQAVPDIPEHFNETLGCVVRGRGHLRELQAQNGCQDAELSSGMAERVREGGRKARVLAGMERRVFVSRHSR